MVSQGTDLKVSCDNGLSDPAREPTLRKFETRVPGQIGTFERPGHGLGRVVHAYWDRRAIGGALSQVERFMMPSDGLLASAGSVTGQQTRSLEAMRLEDNPGPWEQERVRWSG
jgi:hypothetical protein